MTSRAPALGGLSRPRGTARPARPAATRPPLSIVLPTASRAPRTPFVLCVGALLSLGLLCLLLLNTVLAQGSFTVHDLQRRTALLADQQQQLQTAVSLAGSPGVLSAKAKRLGLVQVRDPAFIRANDGRVLGHPTKAVRPYVAPKPSPVNSAAPTGASAGAPTTGTTPAAKPTSGASTATTTRSSRPSAKPTPRRSP